MAEWVVRISDIASVYSLTQSEMQTNAENALAVLNGQLGWSLAAVAGALGNAQAESGLNPGTCEQGRGTPRSGSVYFGGGVGLIQWTDYPPYVQSAVHPLLWYARQVSGSWWDGTLQCQLMNYAADPSITSCGMGQGARWGWMDNGSGVYIDFDSYRAFNGTPEDAAKYWLYDLERPASYSTLGARQSYARYWYDYLQGMSPEPPDPPSPEPPTPTPSKQSKGMPVWMMCRRPYLGER